jgi:hypothetical protein
MYNFEAIDESTLTVEEGEILKILQRHDDNMNEEWWLLEKQTEDLLLISPKPRGYVPSNYVEIVSVADFQSELTKKELADNLTIATNVI